MNNAQQQRDTLAPGSIFERKYRIVREIGRGGFGMVYLAHQEKMGRDVAIKVLRSGATQMHESAKERFLREVKIISRLRHPNTVTIHDFGETHDGLVYMVLEFIEGKTVKEILRKEGAQDPRRALAIAAQIARSLAEAHRHGVIHRDLKPANIMVGNLETETDFVKVLDFGIARLARTDQRDLTSVGLPEGERELIGTPRYMSPEQVRGEDLTPASDVYSVGLILYELLVGQPAVTGDTSLALISQQITPEPLALKGIRSMPQPLAALLRRATAKRLPQRFPDAETFGDALEDTLMQMGGALVGSASARQTGRFAAIGAPHTPRSNVQSGGYPSAPGFGAASPRNPRHNSQQTPAADPFLEQATNPVQRTFGHQPQQQQQQAPQHFGLTPGISTHQGGPSNITDNAALPFTNQVYDFAEGQPGLDPALPPPPSDTNLFSAPDPAAVPEADEDPRLRPQKEQTSSLEFAFQFLRLTVFGLTALIGLYLSFILVAPLFGHFLSGTFKLIATAILASAIPLLTALGENSKRERFDVIDKPYDRIIRVFVGTAIFSFGTGILCSLAMSGSVVNDLRKFPNWFLNDAQRVSKAGQLNEKISLGVAQIVEEATTAIGIYEGVSHDNEPVAPKTMRPAPPPAPTRPATRAQQRAGDENKQNGATRARPDLPAPTRPGNTKSKPAPAAPAPKRSDNGNSDYVDW